MKQLSQEELYDAYAQFIFSPAGQVVMDDLEHTFTGNYSEPMKEILNSIPHPYRAYFEQGLRQVITGIKEAAINGEYLRGQVNDRPSDRPEPDGFTD